MPLGLFAGCLLTPTRKKSRSFEQSATSAAASASSCAEEAEETRYQKGAASKTGIGASEWPISGPCGLPCRDRSGAGRERLEPRSLGASGRRAQPPYRFQMAKVELEGVLSEVHAGLSLVASCMLWKVVTCRTSRSERTATREHSGDALEA
jgi:hypothetical protein